jgi:hypothetical protein
MPVIMEKKHWMEKRKDPRWKLKLSSVAVKYKERFVPIDQHPYTLALMSNDKQVYEKAISKIKHQQKKESSKWENLLRLRSNIKTNGYIPGKEPIILKWSDGGWYASHGRHRICLLWHLYGPRTLLLVSQSNKIAYVWRVVPRSMQETHATHPKPHAKSLI